MELIPARLELLQAYGNHLTRLINSAGKGGVLFFNANTPGKYCFSRHEQTKRGWQLGLSEPEWQRTWLLIQQGEVVGHCDLHGGRTQASLHRTSLGMGIEKVHSGQGFGGRLLETALEFARLQQLSWVDLNVFSSNAPALALYRKFGFSETGRVPDAFRVLGQSFEDVAMTLQLDAQISGRGDRAQ